MDPGPPDLFQRTQKKKIGEPGNKANKRLHVHHWKQNFVVLSFVCRLSSRWKNSKAFVIAVSQILAAPAIAGVLLAPTPKLSFGLVALAYITAETWLGPAAAIVQVHMYMYLRCSCIHVHHHQIILVYEPSFLHFFIFSLSTKIVTQPCLLSWYPCMAYMYMPE